MKKHIFSLVLAIIIMVSMNISALAANTSASKGIACFEMGRYIAAQDGTLWYWGFKKVDSNKTVKAPSKVMSDVAAIVDCDHVILKNGDLYRFGDENQYGKKGVVVKDVIAAKLDYLPDKGYYFVKKDGSLMYKKSDSAKSVKIMADAVDISSNGNRTFFALKSDGSLWGWGEIGVGLMGDGKVGYMGGAVDKPVKIMDNVVSFSAMNQEAYAVTKDGTLWAWGSAKSWSKGIPYQNTGDEEIRKPFEMMKGVKSVLATNFFQTKYVIKTDNSLWAWTGDEHARFIGNGKDGPASKPVKVTDNVLAVDFGTLIKTDGSVWAWGPNNNDAFKNGIGSGSTKQFVLSPEKVQGVKYK